MENRFIQKTKTCAVKTSRRFLTVLLISVMLFSLCACAGHKSGGANKTEPVTVEREPEPQALQTAYAATALALRQYVYARLKTESFVTADFKAMSMEELSRMVDELAGAWETANRLAPGAEEIADQSLAVLDASIVKQTAASSQPEVRFMTLAAKSVDFSVVALAADGAKEFDPKTWAENLTKQYDAIKGGQTIKQLAKQLGTDAKSAYQQLVMAQDIIRSGAIADAEFYDKLTKIAQGTKTACKVGLFVTATIASGGGTLSALAGSSMTLGQAGAAIVGGADCIVDVYSTGSTIILGENHQVTVGFDDIKDKLAPVSAVVGLATFNPAETGEQLSYIGDTLADWFFEGKILGVKLTGDQSGGTTVKAQPIDVSEASEAAGNAALKAANFIAPGKNVKTISELMGEYQMNSEDAIARLDALASQMAAIAQAAGQLEESAEPGNADEVLEALGVETLAGTYAGKMTMTKIEVVYDTEDVDENGNILHVYRPDGSEDVWGNWEGHAFDVTLEFVQEGNRVRILDEDGETAFELAYDVPTGLWKSRKNFSHGTTIEEGEFSSSGGQIHVRIVVTETYENSEVPDGVNETVLELTRSN